MRYRCLAAVLATALLAVGGAAGAAPRPAVPSHSGVTLASAHTARTHRVYLPGGWPKRTRPHHALWSGDGTDELRHLRWNSWNTHRARGHGVEYLDNCVPGCANGHISHYPVRLRAYDPHYLRCGHFFEKVHVRYTARVPRHAHRTWVFKVDPSDNAVELYTIGPCAS